MKDFRKKWDAMNTLERVATAVSLGCSVAIVVLGVLYLLDLAALGLAAAMPLMGLAAVAESVLFWKKDRVVAAMIGLLGLFLLGAYVFYGK